LLGRHALPDGSEAFSVIYELCVPSLPPRLDTASGRFELPRLSKPYVDVARDKAQRQKAALEEVL
jgi:hypothetical protein